MESTRAKKSASHASEGERVCVVRKWKKRIEAQNYKAWDLDRLKELTC